MTSWRVPDLVVFTGPGRLLDDLGCDPGDSGRVGGRASATGLPLRILSRLGVFFAGAHL